MEYKSLKILGRVHQELKIFAAKNNESISDIATHAIMRELTERGHKFIPKHKQSNKK
jgi:hypothetical protein